jgi:hypothetical protein
MGKYKLGFLVSLEGIYIHKNEIFGFCNAA